MTLYENQTKFSHKAKASWGEGVFRRYEGNYIIVEFSEVGEKKFPPEVIGEMLMPIEETKNTKVMKSENTHSNTDNHLIQFDGETKSLGGKNVISAFESENVLLFNESYTVVGSLLKAEKIHAMYDLTVIGDLDVSECVVNGTLMVVGNVNAETLNCANTCVIQGNADIRKLFVGGDFIADSVNCDEFSVEGNAVIRTTIDINSTAKVEKTIVACEGIMGAGSFSALNAIANEYFEFDGDVSGKILELETDTTLSEISSAKNDEQLSLHDLILAANEAIDAEYEKCLEYEEDALIEALNKVETDTTNGWIKGPENRRLFEKLVDISYKEKIDTIEEYLYVLYAKKNLPEKLYNYETVEFVDSLISESEMDFDQMVFAPDNVEAFITAVDMALSCCELSGIELDELFDKIFEAIGLRYNTVKTIFQRNRVEPSNSVELSRNGSDKASQIDNEEPSVQDAFEMPKENREDFLKKKITHLAKQYGITNTELERLASIRVRTCEDFISLQDDTIVNAFGRKAFLAKHLIMAKNKMADKVDEMV